MRDTSNHSAAAWVCVSQPSMASSSSTSTHSAWFIGSTAQVSSASPNTGDTLPARSRHSARPELAWKAA